jgi:hypothetical protein
MADTRKVVDRQARYDHAGALEAGALGSRGPRGVQVIPARVAMSWIRALANDWEEERERSTSHPETSQS